MISTQNSMDILTTAVEGGIGYWSVVHEHERADDLSWVSVTLHPVYAGDFEPVTVKASDLGKAMDRVTSGEIRLRSDIEEAIRSGDPGMIDSDAADCIVQIAALGKVVYG